MSIREILESVSIGRSATVSVNDQGSVCIEDGTFVENTVHLNAKEARALLRALRKFEIVGLLAED